MEESEKEGGRHQDRNDVQSHVLVVPPLPDQEAHRRVLSAIYNNDNHDCNENDDDWKVTSQVKIDTRQNPWILTSFDRHGNAKSVGGDEYYIAYTHHHPTTTKTMADHRDIEILPPTPYAAVALIEDRLDGSYSLHFSATPTCPLPPPPLSPSSSPSPSESDNNDNGGAVSGMLTVYFQYSCGIGSMPPPSKQAWRDGAYTHTKYEVPIESVPMIRPFVNPNCNNHHNDTTNIDLNQFDLICCLGDSTMEQLLRQRPNPKGKYMYQSNLSFRPDAKVTFGLNTRTVSTFIDMLEETYGDILREYSKNSSQNVAIMLGSCLWDILDSKDTVQGATKYDDHRQACIQLIRHVRQAYPNATLLWKSPTAVHIHVVDLERMVVSRIGQAALFGLERLRYMSASRSKLVYGIQKQIVMQEQRQQSLKKNVGDNPPILFLDLYEATYLSADWLFPSDGRHYRPDLNRLMLQWFYPYSIATTDDMALGAAAEQEKEQVPPVVVYPVTRDDKGEKLLSMPKPYYRDPTYIPG